MRTRFGLLILIMAIILLTLTAVIGFGIWHSASNTPWFDTAGYILQTENRELLQLEFPEGSKYSRTLSGGIQFAGSDGGVYTVPRESFAHLEDSSVMALADGILLDFDDLTENFINNYFIAGGLRVSASGSSSYTVRSDMGNMQFGEHLWKLSDSHYIVVSPRLKIFMGGSSDMYEVSDFVQVRFSEDGIAQLITRENVYMTISPACYIETQGGVKVYPISQIVDDGSYKLSVAKLSVSTEDAIMLTEAETRRQIVPELNITAVDGEDGTDGATGADGTQGSTGEDGEAGAEGKGGNTGEGGATGEGGKEGDDGGGGRPGEDADPGKPGKPGTQGGPGEKGPDAVVESSTNNSIPTMSISDWQVSATGLKGSITVKDNSGMLEAMMGETGYPGKVTITNVKTGEVVSCYEVDIDTGKIIDTSDTGFTGFYSAEEVPFSTLNDPLTPDTEYKLSVTAHYTTTDESGIIYSREFISRRFFTDSTGINLSHDYSTVDKVALKLSLADEHIDNLRSLRVYLLDPGQNESFSASVNPETYTDYVDVYTVTDQTEISKLLLEGSLEFSFDGKQGFPLNSNSSYIARLYLTSDTLTTVTKQELEVMTLKQPPTVEKDAQGQAKPPVVDSNRQNGTFEVSKPVVEDPDGGAVKYIYTAYVYEDNEWKAVASKELAAGTKDPVEFPVTSGLEHRFGVTMEFDDNYKTVIYDLGTSEIIKAVGDTLPKLTLTPLASGQSYDIYSGRLRISLGPNSKLVSNEKTRPIRLELFADSVMTQPTVIEVWEGHTAYVNGQNTDMGTITVKEINKSYVDLDVDLKLLYRNTNYSITVGGHLDVNDGNGAVSRTIGSVSFKTYGISAAVATFSEPTAQETEGHRLALWLKLELTEPETVTLPDYEQQKAYTLSRITGGGSSGTDTPGQVTVTLYQGVGPNKRPISTKNFNEKADVLALFSDEGLLLTEEHFGVTIDSGANYTLTITSVADSSYSKDLGYVNILEKIINETGTTAGVTQPPDLSERPHEAIDVKPITNIEAEKYGGEYSEELPDDAVVGFTLQADYENSQRIGVSISYYVYEYRTFLNSLKGIGTAPVESGKTPLDAMQPLMKMTRPISDKEDKVPGVAILFGETSDVTSDENTGYGEGFDVYTSAAADFDGTNLLGGMSRGFRYVFAYDVVYSISASSGEGSSSSNMVYPYEHVDIKEFQDKFGGFEAKGETYGARYVLTSPVSEAPLILPDFHAYINSSSEAEMQSAFSAQGSLELHYTWRDLEGKNNPINRMVSDNTKLSFHSNVPGDPDVVVQLANPDNEIDNSGWYSVPLSYSHINTSLDVFTPRVNVGSYRINYTDYLEDVEAENYIELGPFPVDWSWDEMINRSNSGFEGVVLQEQHMEKENYILYHLIDINPGSNSHDTLGKRGISIDLTFTAQGADGGEIKREFSQPILYDRLNNAYFIRIMTSELGSAFLDTTYTVKNAMISYDNGSQGWSIPDKSGGPYVMQYISEGKLGGYLGSVPANEAQASGAMSSTSNSDVPKALRSSIDPDDPEKDKKVQFARSNLMGNPGAIHYLYPQTFGVGSGNSANIKLPSSDVIIPKGVSTKSLKLMVKGGSPSDSITGQIKDLTPTSSYGYISPTTSSLEIEELMVDGLKGAGSIWMRLYDDETKAYGLDKDSYLEERELQVDENGKVTSSTLMEELEPKKTYYITLHYKDSSNQPTLLINKSDADKAVYKAVTSSDNTITVTDMKYTNDSYVNKELKINFSLSIVQRQSLKFDIYKSKDDAEAGDTSKVHLSHEEMIEADKMLVPPNSLQFANNTVTLLLNPAPRREKLLPGATYYMRISSFEGEKDSGYTVHEFTLNKIGSYGALFYVEAATRNAIDFRVTITDPEYSLIGDSGLGAKYVVRFTDDKDHRIYTTYDNQIFSAFEPLYLQRHFKLNAENIIDNSNNPSGVTHQEGLYPETYYKMYVYAVPDPEHDGVETLDGTEYSYEKLLEPVVVNGQQNYAINLLVDKLWDSYGNPNGAYKTLEKKICIASKSQTTTSKDDWLLNEQNIYSSRESSETIRINFAESINLIKPGTNGDEHVFPMIDWQVEGNTDGKEPIKVDGTVRLSANDKLLQKGVSAGNPIFYFDVPTSLVKGYYTIVLNLHTSQQSDLAKTYRITIRTGV